MKIFKDLKVLIKVAQLCVIVPHYRPEKDDFALTKGGFFYSSVLFLVIFATTIFFSAQLLFYGSDYRVTKTNLGDTEEINQTIESLFCILSYTMVVASFHMKRSKHFQTIREMQKVDDTLTAIGYTGQYRCRLLLVLLIVVGICLWCTAFVYIHLLSSLKAYNQCVLLIAYALQIIMSSVLALYLHVVLKTMSLRLEFVNKRLDEFTKNLEKDNWRELSSLIEVFCKFRYMADNINSVSGISLLCYMGFAFYTVTNQSYLAFSTMTMHESMRAGLSNTMGLSLAWVVTEVMLLIVVCSSCDTMASEANTTAQILARVYGKSKEFQNIIDKFLTKSIKQEVQFTAYGFFVIDNSTLFKIFSAVTTYLVILIQFKQLEESKLEDYAAET